MSVTLMDCTLRDGANVVGKGFSAEMTDLILEGLTSCNVPVIEFGNAGGIGAYEAAGFTDAETDSTYLALAKKYKDRGSELGMFLNAKRYRPENILLARDNGLSFLRVGADAGDAALSLSAIREIKKAGMKAYYSAMKTYILTPDELAREGQLLESQGLDMITIMDSAGTMSPGQVAQYTQKLKAAVQIPVAFHGHNNLGLSAANALAAFENGADILDCGLMGMARSAGNLATEICVALMQRLGQMETIDLYKLLDFIENHLSPAMKAYSYHTPITPLDLVLGLSGCHSSFVKKLKAAAEEQSVSLFRLIAAVSVTDRKNPSDQLITQTAKKLKSEGGV